MCNKSIIGLIAIVAIVAVGMCTGYAETTSATSESEPALAPGYKWYQDDEFRFKIAYPESWTVTPMEEKDLYRGLLGSVAFSDPNTPSINTFSVMISSEINERLKSMEGKDVVINGREGYEVITSSISIGGAVLRVVTFTVDDRYYQISCITSKDLFDEYAATFDNAINSFVIEYPEPVTPMPSPSVTPTPKEGVPGFEAVFAIAGLLAVVYIWRTRK